MPIIVSISIPDTAVWWFFYLNNEIKVLRHYFLLKLIRRDIINFDSNRTVIVEILIFKFLIERCSGELLTFLINKN